MNNEKKSSSKNYYIILKYQDENKDKNDVEEYAIQELNNNFFKIKEGLSRCGNVVEDISSEEEILNIFFSFLNSRMYLNN